MVKPHDQPPSDAIIYILAAIGVVVLVSLFMLWVKVNPASDMPNQQVPGREAPVK